MTAGICRVIASIVLASAAGALALGQPAAEGPRYATKPPVRPAPQPAPVVPTIPPRGPAEPIMPEIIIVPPARVRPWREAPVQLQGVNASVTIDEQVGTTSLEMTLWNPAGRPQEAQLVLPVPDGVSIRSFQYDGTGPEPTAVLLPREEARRIYDSIVNRSKDPGLLEFAGYNVIKTSVFPVPAGAKQSVRLVYEQVLTADAGRVDYFLPRSEALGASGVTWTMSATIKSSRPIATVYSASHEIAIDRQGSGSVTVRVPERAATTPGAFRVSFVTGAVGGEEIATTFLAYPDPSVAGGKGGYFLLLGGLPQGVKRTETAKREVTLVIDRSGSMRGAKMEQAKNAAQAIIDGLDKGEAFNVIDFSDSIRSFANEPVVKDNETAAKVRAYIGAIESNGGTALHDALVEALRPKPMEGMLPLVIFLTDGLPTVGERSELKIREDAKAANTFKRRVFTFGVGLDVNTPLLAAVAKGSRGAATYVMPEENVEVAVSQVFRRLVGPVLSEPKLSAFGPMGKPSTTLVREVMPGVLPDYFDGDQVIVLGQYTEEGKIRLDLEGTFLGKAGTTFTYTLDTAGASARNGFVPRLWATRKIASLIEEIRMSGAAPGRPTEDPRMKELVDEVIRLSTKYGILTEYTSFLATDHEGQRADGGGAAVPMAAAPAMAKRDVSEKLAVRSGGGGVSQESNVKALSEQTVAGRSNVLMFGYAGGQVKQVELGGVQMVDQHALYQRAGNRWVDSRILADEDKEPEKTVEFGTPEYNAAVDVLARDNMLWVLTNPGDLYLLIDGKRTLLKAAK